MRLVLLSLASQGPSENLKSATKMMSVRGGINKNFYLYYVLLQYIYYTPYQYAAGNVLVTVNQQ